MANYNGNVQYNPTTTPPKNKVCESPQDVSDGINGTYVSIECKPFGEPYTTVVIKDLYDESTHTYTQKGTDGQQLMVCIHHDNESSQHPLTAIEYADSEYVNVSPDEVYCFLYTVDQQTGVGQWLSLC